MASQFFITKPQFESIYDHFNQMNEDDDASREELRIECKLLLGYFRSLFEDTERKTKKIMQLTAEMTKCKGKSDAKEKEKEKDVEGLKQQLAEMKQNHDNHRKEEMVLLQLIEELRENISNLRATKDTSKSKSDIYINRRQTIPPSKHKVFREIPVGSAKILKSSRRIENEKYPKNEQSKNYIAPQEIEFMKRKFENEIERLQNQIKVISTESKLLRSEAISLKKRIETKDNYFSEYKQQLLEKIEFEKQEKESLQLKNSSLQILINNLVNDLKMANNEKRILQEDIKNSIEEKHRLLLQIQENYTHIENLKVDIDSLTKSKESAAKRASLFEENLTMDREQLTTAKRIIDDLHRTIDKLETDLKEKESQLNHEESLRKRIEASQKSELLEQAKLIDYYKIQLAVQEKRITSLSSDLEETNEKLAFCRRQLRNKKRDNAVLSEEFQKWKKNLGINSENMKSLKIKLSSAETSKSVLQSELKFTKSQYFSVLKERNKLLAQRKQMDSVIENREMENKLLNNRQEYLINDVKTKDTQLENIAKLRRLAWAK